MYAPHASLPPPPLTTRWNPQLDLFLGPLPRQAAPRHTAPGALSAAQWRQQERLLARGARAGAWRRLAREADRLRPPPEDSPRADDYRWAWPSFTSLVLDAGFAYAAPPRFALSGLQSAEQRDALAELLREIAQHVAFALSQPCPVYATPEAVRIELLGCMAFVANRERCRLQLELRDAEGEWQLSLLQFDLDRPLGEAGWVEQVLLAWLPRIEVDFDAGAAEAFAWLRQKLLRHFGQRDCLQATERQIRHCLLTEPALVRVLRRINRHRPSGQRESRAYSELWSRAGLWVELDRKAPNLVLFYYLAAHQRQIRAGAQLGELRARCRQLGLSPAGWRFLCRFGERAYEGLLLLDERNCPTPLEIVIAYLQWQAAADLRQPLPLAHALSLDEAMAFHMTPGSGVVVAVDPRLARVAAAHAPAPHGGGREPIDFAEWQTVLNWLARDRFELDANQWRAGWPAIRRARERWLRQRLDLRWDSLEGPFECEGWRVRPLTSGRELVEEGQRMQHCAANYIRACHEGRYRMFTAEHPQSGEPAATIGLACRKGVWRLDQVKGAKNREVDEAMARLGAAVLERYVPPNRLESYRSVNFS